MGTMDKFLLAIKTYEGYYPPSFSNLWRGSVSYRNRNPINLRYSYLQAGTRGGFAYFDTYEQGYKAAKHQFTIIANGSSPAYNALGKAKYGVNNCKDLTLLQTMSIFSPSNDGNHPLTYALYLAKQLNWNLDTKISKLLA